MITKPNGYFSQLIQQILNGFLPFRSIYFFVLFFLLIFFLFFFNFNPYSKHCKYVRKYEKLNVEITIWTTSYIERTAPYFRNPEVRFKLGVR